MDATAPQFENRPPESQESKEIISPLEISRAHLGRALAFRVRLEHPEQLPDLINALRVADDNSEDSEKKWLITAADGLDSAIGFIRSPEQLEHFHTIVAKYPGRFGLGASRGDSQLAIASKTVGEREVSAFSFTGSDTNGAARVAMYEPEADKLGITPENHLLFSNENIDPKNLKAYRYLDEQEAPSVPTEKQTVGAKKRKLEIVDVKDDYFGPQGKEASPLASLFKEKGVEQTALLRHRFEILSQESLTNMEAATLSVDVNSFSEKIHKYSKRIQQNPEDMSILQERDKYLDSIMLFFDAVETEVLNRVTQSGRSDLLPYIKLLDWRGDAGGVLVPKDLEPILMEALTSVITRKDFQHLEIKVSVSLHEKLQVMTASSERAFVPTEVDEADKALSGYIKDQSSDIPEGASVIVEINSAGQMEILHIFEKGRLVTTRGLIKKTTTRPHE